MAINYPKITLITPNYNLGKYLEQTILSVVNQGYPNLEYIIIDGGSTDNSLEIIKKYEAYLTYWVSEPDGGLYDALNKGFSRSSGEIMGWLNSDDMLHQHALFYIAQVFTQYKEVRWIQGRPSFLDKNGGIFNVDAVKPWSKFDFYAGYYEWIQQESTFWRRDLWEQAGGYVDADLRLAGDFELWLRFFGYAKLHSLAVLLGGFRLRGDEQLSKQFIKQYHKEARLALKRTTEYFSTQKKVKIFFVQLLYFFLKKLKKIKVFNATAIEFRWLPKLLGAEKIIELDYEKGIFRKRT